jgi:hypothetical protein
MQEQERENEKYQSGSKPPDSDFNRAPPKYKAGVLTVMFNFMVWCLSTGINLSFTIYPH